MTTLFVAVGGLIGVLGRWGISRLTLHSEALIWSTVGVNILASFLLGLLVAEDWFGGDMREGLGVGLLGGFSTFSTFSVQVVLEAEGGEPGPPSPTWSPQWWAGFWLPLLVTHSDVASHSGRRFGRGAAIRLHGKQETEPGLLLTPTQLRIESGVRVQSERSAPCMHG